MYKYNILYILRGYPKIVESFFRQFLPTKLHVTPKTFENMMYIKANDGREISVEKLRIIAHYLDVDLNKLLGTDLRINQPEKIELDFKKFK